MLTTITVKHPVDEQEAELSKAYADEVYNSDGWEATQYSATRIQVDGGWQDILEPKHNGRRDLRKTVEAYLLSFKFQRDQRTNIFTPPKDVGLCSGAGNRRLSVLKYLEATFKNPRAFLYVLAKRGGFLSGSRALEFWVPGVTDKNSDWDIYVNASALTEIMVVLSKCGVRWLLPEAERVDGSLGGEGCYVQRCLLRYISTPDKEDLARISQRNLYAIYLEARHNNLLEGHGYVWAEKIIVDEKVKIAVHDSRPPVSPPVSEASRRGEPEQIDDTEAEYEGMLVLDGTIQAKSGKMQKVQLISNRFLGNKTSCFSWVANFYASQIQCLIGGWYAVHMYHKATVERKMYIWTLQSQNPESVGKALDKYRKRGFIDACNTRPCWRGLTDDGSCFIDFSHEVLKVGAQPEWWHDEEYCRTLDMSVNEIIEQEKSADAANDDALWLMNRRANLMNIRWQQVRGHTSHPVSALFAENRPELEWAL